MTKIRRKIGQAGENAARLHLENLAYDILETNYNCPLGEIDLVARDGNVVVLVEVRTRTGKAFGAPEESITAAKARRLQRLALYYQQKVYRRDIACRIDLVAVMLDKDSFAVKNINHIKGILS